MLTEDGKHLYVSYDDYHGLIEKLALQIHKSGWQFDTILCLARGGLRPGDILSRIFDKPLAIIVHQLVPGRGRHFARAPRYWPLHCHAQGRNCRARAPG